MKINLYKTPGAFPPIINLIAALGLAFLALSGLVHWLDKLVH